MYLMYKFLSTFWAHLCLFTENDSLDFEYLVFGRSVNLIWTRGADFGRHVTTGTHRFLDSLYFVRSRSAVLGQINVIPCKVRGIKTKHLTKNNLSRIAGGGKAGWGARPHPNFQTSLKYLQLIQRKPYLR